MHLSCVDTSSSAVATDHWSGHKNKAITNTGQGGRQLVEKRKTGMEVTVKKESTMQVAKTSPSTVHMFGIFSNFELPLLF